MAVSVITLDSTGQVLGFGQDEHVAAAEAGQTRTTDMDEGTLNVLAANGYKYTKVVGVSFTAMSAGERTVVDDADVQGQKGRALCSVVVSGNTVVTPISAVDTWVNLELDSLAVAGSNIDLWGSVDSTTGEVTYTGLADFNGELRATLSVLGSGGNQNFQFRAVVNGSPLGDVIVSSADLSSALVVEMPLIASIQCVTNDLVRIQVQNTSGTSDVLVQNFFFVIR